MIGRIVSVSRDGAHRFSKAPVAEIRLIAGLGVEGDAHLGETVQHRSRVAVESGAAQSAAGPSDRGGTVR